MGPVFKPLILLYNPFAKIDKFKKNIEVTDKNQISGNKGYPLSKCLISTICNEYQIVPL